MSAPTKADRKETEIQEARSRCNSILPEILPLISEVPAGDADQLAADLDKEVKAAGDRVKDAENGTKAKK